MNYERAVEKWLAWKRSTRSYQVIVSVKLGRFAGHCLSDDNFDEKLWECSYANPDGKSDYGVRHPFNSADVT